MSRDGGERVFDYVPITLKAVQVFFFVRLFTAQEMISILEIREVLEGLAARRSAKIISDEECETLKLIFADFEDIQAYSRADRLFHTTITRVASREFLTTMLQTFNIISLAYQNVSSEGLIQSPNKTIVDHINIIEAICSRKSEEAERLMRQHIHRGIKILKEQNGNR